ncbi:MAG TPA: FkbM family methyltransferase [Thermoanaerobaculia bacterium]
MKRLIRKLQSLLVYLDAFGVVAGLRVFLRKRKKHGTITLRVPGVAHPLTLRAGTSDLYMFEEVFLQGEYALHESMDKPLDPKLILDVGANVGFASVWFATRYPKAKIIAVEPDASNIAVLRKNVQPYPNVSVVEGAVWWENTTVSLDDQGDKSGIQVRAGDGGVRAMTIPEIAGNGKIDILKLDVEGAEKELFEHDPAWLANVGVLMIELHDRFKPGCSKALYSALVHHDFRELRHQTANWYVS